ncbi:MAG: ABC transporter permease [Phycisphaerales bacterium]
MLKLFLWLKYLRKRRIILLSIAAVAMSVSLLIVVASLFTGFIAAFEQSAVEMLGDVMMAAPQDKKFEKYPALIERLEQSEVVETASAALSSEGLLHLGRGNVRPVSVWGIQPDRRARVTGFKKTLMLQSQAQGDPSLAVPDAPDEIGGFVGIGVVGRPDEETDEYDQQAILKEAIGEQLHVITGTADSAAGPDQVPKRRTISFRVVDLVYSGVHELDSGFVYLPIEALQKELYPGQQGDLATKINIRLKPGVDPYAAVLKIQELWSDFASRELGWKTLDIIDTRVETAQQLQSQYVAEIKKQMGVLLLIFGVVSFSVVVLVFCIFYMMVKLKQRDVAVIKSCGAASSSVVSLFLGFGVSVGVAGSGIGAMLGYVITRNINVVEGWIRILFGLKLWKSSVYMFDKIPNQVDWAGAMPIVGLAILAAALGALIPAIVAARTRPVEVLRYE